MIVQDPPSSGSGDTPAFAELRKPELRRFLQRAKRAAGVAGDVSVLLCDDARIKQLNRSFRGKNKATDVLSFPPGEHADDTGGDLAISVETAARQAEELGHALQDEVSVLLLHGMLHLAGYDHETDDGEMRATEAELRAKLKLPLGLIERSMANGTGGKPPLKKRKGQERTGSPR